MGPQDSFGTEPQRPTDEAHQIASTDQGTGPVFRIPPGWPPAPPGWKPPVGWTPDPTWPEAPPDWRFWEPAEVKPAQPPAAQEPSDASDGIHKVQQASGEPSQLTAPVPGHPKRRRFRMAIAMVGTVVVIGAGALVVVMNNPCRSPSTGDDLTGCDLSGRDLGKLDLTKAVLTNARLASANLSSANLSSANLSGAVLSGANLSGAKLVSARLDKADLSGAVLSSANLSGAQLVSARLDKANLNGAVLTSANLSSAILSGAQLTAHLDKADLSGAILTGANLSDAELESARLQKADLNGVDLTGANLRGADLSGAALTRANLTDADLTGANLSGSTLAGATLVRTELADSVGLSDATLADALGVPTSGLAAKALQRKLHFSDLDDIIAAAAPAASGKAVAGTRRYQSSPSFHPMVVLENGGAAATPEWASSVQKAWMPLGLRFAELAAVADEGSEVVQRCTGYFSGKTGKAVPALVRNRETVRVRVIALATGKVVAQKVLKGTNPRACQKSESADLWDAGLRGGPVDYRKQVLPWLTALVHAPSSGS